MVLESARVRSCVCAHVEGRGALVLESAVVCVGGRGALVLESADVRNCVWEEHWRYKLTWLSGRKVFTNPCVLKFGWEKSPVPPPLQFHIA